MPKGEINSLNGLHSIAEPSSPSLQLGDEILIKINFVWRKMQNTQCRDDDTLEWCRCFLESRELSWDYSAAGIGNNHNT